ncbi:MAG: hypothetical protein WBF76_23915, partial [Pseudonocardiaceae bacterium]
LGRFGKVVLHGKGSLGRGKKDRLVPLINGARELLDWWVTGPRWVFDDRVNDPLAPVFPSERRNDDATSSPVETDALRSGLAVAVDKHLPDHAGRLTRTCCGISPPRISTATAWTWWPSRRFWVIAG